LDKEFEHFRPVTMGQVSEGNANLPAGYNRAWFFDGTFRLRRVRDDVRTSTTVETRELTDVEARLRDMDELGIDVQVCYPTLFLRQISGRPAVEVALKKSYNRWMASRCELSHGRLRWVALMPTLNIAECVKEMEFAKENGAVGIFKKGIEAGHVAGHAYFDPLYDAANQLDLTICLHTASGDPNVTGIDQNTFSPWYTTYPVLDACISLIERRVPERFTNLRFGFIEAMASWVPFVMAELGARRKNISRIDALEANAELFERYRFYTACQTTEDLPYIMKYTGEDHLVIGTDYTHADQSADIEAIAGIKRMGDEGFITPEQAAKITGENAVRLYGLE
jgi:predicted TIM-barrel fold metal-dependent hydrolase